MSLLSDMLVLSIASRVSFKLNISHELPLLVFSCYSELKWPKNILDNWIKAKEHASNTTAAQKDESLTLAPFFPLAQFENMK